MNFIFIFLAIFSTSILLWYLYKSYSKVDNLTFIPNDEYVSDNRTTSTVTLYYTEWCPHCKEMMPEWVIYKTNYSSELYDIAFAEVDCDKNSAETSDINDFPTIILTRGETKYFYDSKFSEETMNKFIDTIMSIPL